MRPPKRVRPVVAVLGDNRGTEAIDFVIPYAVLKQSGAADVFAVGMRPGKLQLRPALAIQAQLTRAELDRLYPKGADYVIVPAMFDHETPEVIAWVRSQAAKGATIVAICAGAEILAYAGLLKDHDATTHWASVSTVLKAEPTVNWRPHRRYVADDGIVTTTGVSAAVPASLAMVEAIAGRQRAADVARELGVSEWGTGHNSNGYRLGSGFWTGVRNLLAERGVQELGVPVNAGVNDIALTLSADAWSRTYRSRAVTIAEAGSVRTRFGLQLLVDRHSKAGMAAMLPPVSDRAPARALDQTFDWMAARFGEDTARFVAVQLEHERGATKP
jgi:putative intracellular protease/amidase